MSDSPESEDDAMRRNRRNAKIEGIETLILAHSEAGINIESPDYIKGVDSAMEIALISFS